MNPTPEQVAQWAREAGFDFLGAHPVIKGILNTVATCAFTEGRAWQAEQDAVICENPDYIQNSTFQGVADAIRANAPKGTM